MANSQKQVSTAASLFYTGLGLVIAGIACFVGFYFAEGDYEHYKKDGVTAEATVIKKHIETQRNAKTGDDEQTFMMDLQFLDKASQPIEDERSVSEETYKNTPEGKQVSVLYLPEKPKEFKVASENESPSYLLWFGGVLALVGGALGGYGKSLDKASQSKLQTA